MISRVLRALAAAVASFCSLAFAASGCNAALRSFSVRDDIAFASFVRFSATGAAAALSPDGKMAVVQIQRGSLDTNEVVESLRFYDMDSLRAFVATNREMSEPPPVWGVDLTAGEGPVISELRWLADSSGVCFLRNNRGNRKELWSADPHRKVARALTPQEQDVTAFDVRDLAHYVFTVRSLPDGRKVAELDAASRVGTGKLLWEVLYPRTVFAATDRSILWASVDGVSKPVVEPTGNTPIVLYAEGRRSLKMAPDGRSVVTERALTSVPSEWVDRYPPPNARAWRRLHAGRQDLDEMLIGKTMLYAYEFVQIDLASGRVSPLTSTPTSLSAGWLAGGGIRPVWSTDGDALLLPGTYLPGTGDTRPSIVVVDPRRKVAERVIELVPESETGWPSGYFEVQSAEFLTGRNDAIDLTVLYLPGMAHGRLLLIRTERGKWERTESADRGSNAPAELQLVIRQDLNHPPVLMAVDHQSGRAARIWDPNPQYSSLAPSAVSVFRWKDRDGDDHVGGLYLPPDFTVGHSYPLVIQTHGFHEDEFSTSGVYPTAFAARSLAATGLIVLQVREPAATRDPEEGPRAVRAYEAAIAQLARDGLVNAERVGIIGFSRTVYYVLKAVTSETCKLRAASITDGINAGYLDYILGVDFAGGADEIVPLIGGSPIGQGLTLWRQRAPNFNLDRVSAPMLITGMKETSALFMWEVYSMLRHQRKPVELLLLNSREHVLTNPAVRLASQGMNVDWFDFWLNGHEDPDERKVEQYARWHKLRDLHESDLKKWHEEQEAAVTK